MDEDYKVRRRRRFRKIITAVGLGVGLAYATRLIASLPFPPIFKLFNFGTLGWSLILYGGLLAWMWIDSQKTRPDLDDPDYYAYVRAEREKEEEGGASVWIFGVAAGWVLGAVVIIWAR